jgi:ABC-2 type transport system permease protein
LVSGIVSQVLIVFVLMFSPLSFPAERLPDWLRAVHSILPIQAMGEVIRGSLATTTFQLTAASFAVLGVWCLVSLTAALVALDRRG